MFKKLLFFIILLFSLSLCRPFDWQYNHLTIPFAVFYNPSLLGNNPGYTVGFDTRYTDSANYDIRGAFVIPIGEVADINTFSLLADNNAHLHYANSAYRSSMAAFSIGGIYNADNSYQLTTGFTVPINLVQSGASVDIMYKDDSATFSLNAGISANLRRIMDDSRLHLIFHNIIANGNSSTYNFGFSIGTSGFMSQDQRFKYFPYEVLLRFYTENGSISATEGMARINFDMFSPLVFNSASRQVITGSLGYGFLREDKDNIDHRFFANLGVTFIGSSSATSVLGGYGSGDNKHAAAIYNSFKREKIGDNALSAVLEYKKTDDGKYIFGLRTNGSAIRSWVLRIDDTRDTSIKTFSGGNVVPSSIVWDGLTSDGSAVEDELIYVKLVLIGRNKAVESNVMVIEREK